MRLRVHILFIFALLLLSATQLHALGKFYAVLVGVSEYKQSANNLTYCHRDALEMYNLLQLKTLSENLVLLTNSDATHDRIVQKTKALFAKAQAGDIVIFFFSGHGSQGSFITHDYALDFKILQQIFKQTKAKRKLIFADACFSGTLREPGKPGSQPASVGNNVLLFMSSRSNQISREQTDLKNGLFTYFLIAGLKGGADTNKNRIITAQELFGFVNPKVREKSGGAQAPVMWGKFDKNMIIMDWNKNYK